MKNLILILNLLLIFSLINNSFAESLTGTAEYAMLSDQWPCNLAKESEKQNGLKKINKAILWNTFGNDTSCLEQYLADPKLESLEIHLINEVCQRHGNCGEYEFLHDISLKEYRRKLIKQNQELTDKLNQYLAIPSAFLKEKLQKNTKCFISPGLESNLNTEAARNLIEIIKPHFPQCKIVWNPVGNNPDHKPIPGTIFETHGSDPDMQAPCIADLDGEDISFPQRAAILPNFIEHSKIPEYFSKYNHCENNFLWVSEFNGISGRTFIDPRMRTAFPTLETFNLVNGLIAANSKNLKTE